MKKTKTKITQTEKVIITALNEYEAKNGNKPGMPPGNLEVETEMTWYQLVPILNKLGHRDLIEMYKGPGYIARWLPVELDETPGSLYRTNFNPIWRFRLKEKGRKEYPKINQEESHKDPITLTVAQSKYHVTVSTLKRAIKDGRLKSYRPKNCRNNYPHTVSESKVASMWPARKN